MKFALIPILGILIGTAFADFWPGRSKPQPIPPLAGVTIFDDFISGNTNNGYPMGAYFRQSGNNGGGVEGGALGSDLVPQANRIGLAGVAIGTTDNSTGDGFVDATTGQMYAGQGAITLQWAAEMPAALATGTGIGVDYVIEMGCGSGYAGGGSAANNSMLIAYKASTSTNFLAETCNNGTCTTSTTLDSTDFAVSASTWYNFQVLVPGSGSQVTYQVAPAGTAAWVTLATVSTNLPTSSHACNLVFQIYKASPTAVNRILTMDWVQFNEVFNASR